MVGGRNRREQLYDKGGDQEQHRKKKKRERDGRGAK